jgi:hypothetical protein
MIIFPLITTWMWFEVAMAVSVTLQRHTLHGVLTRPN